MTSKTRIPRHTVFPYQTLSLARYRTPEGRDLRQLIIQAARQTQDVSELKRKREKAHRRSHEFTQEDLDFILHNMDVITVAKEHGTMRFLPQ